MKDKLYFVFWTETVRKSVGIRAKSITEARKKWDAKDYDAPEISTEPDHEFDSIDED